MDFHRPSKREDWTMGCRVIQGVHGAKGPIPFWLDSCSVGADARTRLQALLDAVTKIGPDYEGLEDVFDTYLAALFSDDEAFRRRLREHLKQHWFSDGRDAYFPGQHVAQKYAEGVIKATELSLNGKQHPVPISAWWIIGDSKDVRMLNLAGVDDNGVTVSAAVTLLICTPMPPPGGAPSNRMLWGDAEIWATDQHTGAVATRRLEKEVRP
jgi:hypothetical protein